MADQDFNRISFTTHLLRIYEENEITCMVRRSYVAGITRAADHPFALVLIIGDSDRNNLTLYVREEEHRRELMLAIDSWLHGQSTDDFTFLVPPFGYNPPPLDGPLH